MQCQFITGSLTSFSFKSSSSFLLIKIGCRTTQIFLYIAFICHLVELADFWSLYGMEIHTISASCWLTFMSGTVLLLLLLRNLSIAEFIRLIGYANHVNTICSLETSWWKYSLVDESARVRCSIILILSWKLTLWLLKGPKPPVRYGTELKNSIFLKQENHVLTLVLKQTLVVFLSLECQLCKNKLSFLQNVINWSAKIVLCRFWKGKNNDVWIFWWNFHSQQTKQL